MSPIKTLRKKHKITQEKLANDLKVSRSTVAMWETNNNEPDNETIIKLANYFNVTTDEVLGLSKSTSKGIKIPVLGRVAAGVPIEAIEEILDFEEITPELASSGEYFALTIKGDSMEPDMREGDVVIVRKQADADSGQIVIAYVNGYDATCKKLLKREDGIMLIPFNQKYDPKFYSCEEIETFPVVILGRVIEARKKY